jgi:hypothetical protein
MSRWSAYRWTAHACALGAVVVSGVILFLLVGPATAGAAGLTLKVNPDRGLVNGQVVTVSGGGLARSAAGTGLTWFVTQCTASVRGRMNPSTDTPHCDVTDAKAVRVGRNGSFSTKLRVRAGIVGDGYCGTAGHTSCVIAVSTAKGLGTAVRIRFTTPKPPATTRTTTA